MVPNIFVFLNVRELTETTDLKGEDVPALGRRWSAPAAAVAVGRVCRQRRVQTSKAALPLSS